MPALCRHPPIHTGRLFDSVRNFTTCASLGIENCSRQAAKTRRRCLTRRRGGAESLSAFRRRPNERSPTPSRLRVFARRIFSRATRTADRDPADRAPQATPSAPSRLRV